MFNHLVTIGLVAIIICALFLQFLRMKGIQRELFMSQAGAKGPDQSTLFIFKDNTCSPGCCPSQFSCSGGCVCMTKQQKEALVTRGNNAVGQDMVVG